VSVARNSTYPSLRSRAKVYRMGFSASLLLSVRQANVSSTWYTVTVDLPPSDVIPRTVEGVNYIL
jgi:hypothetical protein